MNKGFPNTFLGIPIGWQKRGGVGLNYVGGGTYEFRSCGDCKTRVKVGIEDNKPFLYCPKCLIKLAKETK